MAFVAANNSSPLLSGKSGVKREASPVRSKAFANNFRRLHHGAFETSLAAVKGEGEPESIDGAAQWDYDNRAYPATSIGVAQQLAAANAAKAIAKLPGGKNANWQEVGPRGVSASALVASESTGASTGIIYSGRTTAIAVAPNCTPKSCAVFIGAAGGGVWQADNALAPQPNWHPSGSGIPSNAIGSLAFDPNDASGKTLYVGTGEPNGSSDSEAGVGLYKSTDGGKNWSVVAGSTSVATGRSVGAIAIDPANASHIFIGTDVARHGSSSVNGGRFTPAGAPPVGLYESTDGGATFSPVVILAQDTVDPSNPTGGDFFRGGASHVELYRASGETQVYASFFDYGVYRRSNTQDGDTAFHQIFQSAGGGAVGNSSASRTEFSLAPNGGNLRIYVGDAPAPASFWRVDNANVTAATLFTGGTNGGWTKLSNSANGTPGFASFNYCSTQCTYDMPVYSPPGAPNIVYIGSSMQYSEIGGRSNGRAVQRSEDAGVNFTDMTIDTQGVSRHPDQHAMAATPFNPNILFNGDDGGVWRINGSFTDVHTQCASRGLSGNNLIDCNSWLSKVPTAISSMNRGLGTLQYQSLSVNVQNPLNDLMGGTQDNGTHGINGRNGSGFVTFFGDGGNGGINIANPDVRMLTLFSQAGLSQIIATYHFNSADAGAWNPFLAGYPGNEVGWAWVGDPGSASGENMSFYIPVRTDPSVNGTWFFGAQHVWRTQDNGGPQAYLDQHCNLFVGDFAVQCGDWVPIGQDLTSTSFGTDKTPGPAGYVVAIRRAASDTGTLWAGLRRGRVFVASNADNATAANVTFYRIDSASTPTRFVSGIAVDPTNANHAFISFSGYNAYATASGTATGHVFEVTYDATAHTATWTNIDHNLGDEPITDVALDSNTGDLFVSTDFGVNILKSGSSTWTPAAGGLPPAATYGLTIDSSARILYAATHGRGAWSLQLQ
jgi:hypothetical protein